jgi:hypothetical protein
MHGLPIVLHIGLSAAHVLLVQVPLQQAAFDVQAAPSAVHCVLEQLPFTQLVLQQSMLFMQGMPEVAQLLGFGAQVWFAPQSAEQQSAAVAHDCPYIPQLIPPAPPVPPWPPEPALSSPHPTAATIATMSEKRIM